MTFWIERVHLQTEREVRCCNDDEEELSGILLAVPTPSTLHSPLLSGPSCELRAVRHDCVMHVKLS